MIIKCWLIFIRILVHPSCLQYKIDNKGLPSSASTTFVLYFGPTFLDQNTYLDLKSILDQIFFVCYVCVSTVLG